MTTFVETIRLEGGRFHLLPLHQERMEATMREVYGLQAQPMLIADALAEDESVKRILSDPEGAGSGVYKCRVVYDSEIRLIEVLPYSPRTIRSLKMVEASPGLDYHLKSCDRSALSALASLKGECDEVIIVRDGLITDTSYTNLVFHGRAGLYTPRHPLLAGVMRRHLLESGAISELDLRPEDIRPGNPLGIEAVSLVNALLPFGQLPAVPVSAVF